MRFAERRRGLGCTCLCVFFVRSLSVITFIPTIFHFAVFLLLILLAHVCRQVPHELFVEALPRLYFCVRVWVQLLSASVVGNDFLSTRGIDRATTDQGAVDFCLRTVVCLLLFFSVQAANTETSLPLDGQCASRVGCTGLGRPILCMSCFESQVRVRPVTELESGTSVPQPVHL